MRLISSCILGTLIATAFGSAAMADDLAIVSKVGGKGVTWQHGDKTAPARVQTLLGLGDRITAGKGSFVDVRFVADNCSVRVDAGSSLAIGNTSPCADAAQQKADAAKSGDAKIIPVAVETAEVLETRGPVTRVNKGEGMASATVGDSLKVGDAVFAGKDSSVSLYFAAAKCSYVVPASTVYTVADRAPCQATAANVVPTADVPGSTTDDPSAVIPPFAAAGIAPVVLVTTGAVVVAGTVAVIASSSNSSGGSPATPD